MSFSDKLSGQTQPDVNFNDAAQLCFAGDAKGLANQDIAAQIDAQVLGQDPAQRGM